MDLTEMQSMQRFNDGYRYLLVCIDVFSKYAWVVRLKNKTGLLVVNAFKTILSSGPEKIITDQGTEFLNKHFKALLKDEDIELYNTYHETKAFCRGTFDTYAENKNVAILFPGKKTMRYIDTLTDLVYLYNHNVHCSIKKKPADVTFDNEKKVWHMLYDDHDEMKHPAY